MKIKEFLASLDVSGASEAVTFETSDMSASVNVIDDGSSTAQITIEGQWMGAADLRQAAKLFKRLADKMDERG